MKKNTLASLVMLFIILFAQFPQNVVARSPHQDISTSTPMANESILPSETPTQTPGPTLEQPTASPTVEVIVLPTETVTEVVTATVTGSPTETATEIPQSSETLTPDVTATATPTATLQASPTPDVTATATPTATLQASPTPDVTATTTPTATFQASPTATLSQLQINLQASPEFIRTGGKVSLNWTAGGPGIEAFDILFSLPDGISLANDNPGGSYDASSRIYRLPANATPPLKLLISSSAEVPLIIQAALFPQTAALADFLENRIPSSKQETLTLVEKVRLPKTGGKASGLNGRVSVTFLDGTLTEGTDVFIQRPARERQPRHSLAGHLFEITAKGSLRGNHISKFGQELELQVSYADENIPAEQENDLAIHWYDPQTDDWISLPGYVDRENKIIHAYTTHFTVFDYDVENWQASHLPTIENFQVSGFTGAATYDLPIDLPQGPDGLTPDFSLSYNSQVVDKSSSLTQASWVGMGWSLDVGSIERNTNSTSWYTGDDSFFITMNGISSRIVRDTSGVYHLAQENFWQVSKLTNPDSWVLRDKIGNEYYFEELTNMRYHSISGIESCGLSSLPIRWQLTRYRNIYDKEIVYEYAQETKKMNIPENRTNASGVQVCGTGTTDADVTTASYLSAIQYPGNTYRVEFSREARADFKSSNASDGSFHDFMRTRLDHITVEYYASTATYTPVKQYYFDYFANTDTLNLVYPGITWNTAGKTSTLYAVRVGNAVMNKTTGVYNFSQLQQYTFSYVDGNTADNNLHIKSIDNGLGGVVSYTYERWNSGYASDYHTVAHYFGKPNMPCNKGLPDPYRKEANISGTVDCADNTQAADELIVTGQVSGGSMTKNLVVPGGLYKVQILGTTTNDSSMVVGWYDGNAFNYFGSGLGTFTLDPDAKDVKMMIKETGTGVAHIVKAKFQLMSAGWRIKTRKQTHAETNSIDSEVSTYSYIGAAVNTHANTDASLLCDDYDLYAPPLQLDCAEYIPEYSEFRGHSQVTVSHPDGTKTVTVYQQDYLHVGEPLSVSTLNASGIELNRQTYEYAVTEYTNTVSPGFEGCHVGNCWYSGVFRYWSTLTAEENHIYDDSNNDNFTRQEYIYGSYGNRTTMTEYVDGQLFQKISMFYFPGVGVSLNLTGLTARVMIQDENLVLINQSLYLYDNADIYTTSPTKGVLSAVRTLVDTVNGNNRYRQTKFMYESFGNITTETTSTGYYLSNGIVYTAGVDQVQQTVYDSSYHTYPVKITDAEGGVTTLQYDMAIGKPKSETNPNGAVTTAAYDNYGRMVSITRPGDSTPTFKVTYTSSSIGMTVLTQQLIDGSRYLGNKRYYDGWGRQYKQESGSVSGTTFTVARSVETSYINANNTKQSMPYGPGENAVYTTRVVNSSTQTLTVTNPDTTKTIVKVDGLNSIFTDANGKSTTTKKDIHGNVTGVTPPLGPDVTYTYDALNRLKITTRGGSGMTLTYNFGGQKTSMTDPDLGSWNYKYDALGNLKTQIDARGCSLSMSHDDLNRLLNKSSSGTGCGSQVNESFAYNSIGLRSSMIDGSGSTAWTYDLRGRQITEKKTITGTAYNTYWTYNSGDQVVSMTYPDGEVVTTAYNNLMQPNSLIGDNTYEANAAYDSAGRMISRTLGNGLKSTFTYNAWNTAAGRLKKITSGTLQDLAYTYDAVGNILGITDAKSGETQSYTYDSLDRLTGWKMNGIVKELYGYNASTGNLTTSGGATLTYGEPSHDHAVTAMGSNTYSYDANGNQKARTIAGVTYSLGYDAENRMVSVSSSGLNASFVYDGDGRRVKSTINGVVTTFIGNHYEVSTGMLSKYYFLGGARVAMRQAGLIYYPLTDHLGSTTLTTDESGAVVSELRYTAWGKTRFTSGSTPTKYQFTGQYSNSYINLLDYGSRYYDPALGRFISPDTIVPLATQGTQAFDRYAYANNNAVRYTDPTGHAAIGDTNEGGCNTPSSPKCIIDRYGYNSTEIDRELENYHRANPTYDPSTDSSLEGTDQTIVVLAISRVGCANGGLGDCVAWAAVGFATSPVPTVKTNDAVPQNYGNDPANSDCVGCGFKDPQWQFGGNHSNQKWQNQMTSRGWTSEQISEAIVNGQSFPANNFVHPGNQATRYINPNTGRSIVIDNITREVIHIGGDSFGY